MIFSKVVSLFSTTLASSMTAGQVTMTPSAIPSGDIQYPNWFVIEPNTSNVELVYCPTAPIAGVYSGVVRGVDPTLDTDAAGTGTAHPANSSVILAPLHRQWNNAVDVFTGAAGTGYNAIRVGDGTASSIYFYAQNNAANKPFIRYDQATSLWLVSNDGVSTYAPSSSGATLTTGPGVAINANAITLNVCSNGGLRNNQGVGSIQADVDPGVVGRLDTVNTWAANQTFSAGVYVNTPAAGSSTGLAANDIYVNSQSPPDYGDGSDGAGSIASGTTTLTRDMYYTTLVVQAGATLVTNSFRIFAQTSVDVKGTGKITNNGSTGGTGGTGAGGGGGAGTAGTAVPAGSMPAGTAGGLGANTSGTEPHAGVAGGAGGGSTRGVNPTSGAAGGAGGALGTNTGGAGGTGGANTTAAVNLPRNLTSAINLFDFTGPTGVQTLGVSSSGGGGGSAGQDTNGWGGAGGGGGSCGGFLFIASPLINVESGGAIQANGGIGGTGGAACGANESGGGGGGGGNGGVVMLAYSSILQVGTVTASGGAGGPGGAPTGLGYAGVTGTTGAAGLVIKMVF